MISLYYRPRCSSSIKAIDWFKKYKIDICLKSPNLISREELITVLSSTDKGIFDVIRQVGRASDEDKDKIHSMNKMTLNQAIEFIKINPELLKSPIIIKKNKVLIGYNADQIRMFLPKAYRRSSLNKYFKWVNFLLVTCPISSKNKMRCN